MRPTDEIGVRKESIYILKVVYIWKPCYSRDTGAGCTISNWQNSNSRKTHNDPSPRINAIYNFVLMLMFMFQTMIMGKMARVQSTAVMIAEWA